MKNTLKQLIAPVATVLVSFAPVLVHAQPGSIPTGGVNDIDDIIGTTKGSWICDAAAYLFWILIVAVLIFVVVAAFRYLTAAGDPEKVKKANYTLIYAAVAIVVALIARTLPQIVNSFTGSGNVASVC